eukprot:scaffold1.g5884.t1
MAQTYALFQALMAGDWEVAKVLLEQRQPWQGRRPADPLARFHYGQTTLIAAAQGGCVEAVAPLVAAGVPVDAALDRNTPASKPLQSHIKRNYTDHELLHMYCLADGMTALHVAADRGDDRMVADLLAAGASVDRRDFRRRAPLSQVVEGAVADATASRVECARLLMEAGADPLGQLSADERASALGYACWIGGRRGDLAQDSNGKMLLEAALNVSRRRASTVAVVRLLVDAGAPVSIGALCAAASAGLPAAVEMLLAQGSLPPLSELEDPDEDPLLQLLEDCYPRAALRTPRVARCAEVLLAAGCHPGRLPAKLLNQLPDLLRLALVRQPWSPGDHTTFPPAFRAAAKTFLLVLQRRAAMARAGREEARPRKIARRIVGRAAGLLGTLADAQTGPAALPQEIVLRIIGLAAYPISSWLELELEEAALGGS